MKPVILLALIFILLPACSPAPMPTPAPSITVTLTLPTRTPLPTIPTFTPTFDVRTIVTVTPAPKAGCPQIDPNRNVEAFPSWEDLENFEIGKEILTLLNAETSIIRIRQALSLPDSWGSPYGEIKEKDLTNDGVPEVIVELLGSFIIYTCHNRNYAIAMEWYNSPSSFAEIMGIIDMNLNGIPEIITTKSGCSGVGCRAIRIYQWNGHEFQQMLRTIVFDPTTNTTKIYTDGIGMDGPLGQEITDVNGDGTFEFIMTGGGIIGWRYKLERPKTETYQWDGEAFILSSQEFTEPNYRFQAIQDADMAVSSGRFAKAFSLYQDAISTALDWWSPERGPYLDYDENYGKYNDEQTPLPNLTPRPLIDTTEYPRLAAYAYYRMVILHTHLGETEAAQTKYATLQEKFPVGDPGHPYVEMAMAFWNSYEATGKMYDACAAAIAYADAHPKILMPLGSDYHGLQSHKYTPADVCPFR